MQKRFLRVGLVLTETFKNDSIRPLAEQLDFAVRTPHDRRHTLPGRVELANVQDFILERLTVDVDEHRFRLAGLFMAS